MEGNREGEAGPPPSREIPDEAHAATVRRPSGADATRIAPSSHPGVPPLPGAPSGRIGRYELRGLLGRGAMGTVYRAFDTQLKRDVALKLLQLHPGDTGELFQRFRLEAEAAARLRHPNLVAVFDLGSENGQPYLTMELLEGGSLARLIGRRGGRLPPNEAMRLARDVALGLACAHENGIVHRDLKPENILLESGEGETLRPKISDFGLAHSVGTPGDARLTIHGTILGTPVYMAPEQAEGKLELVDARSDIYALGAVLYETASGRPAYVGKDPMAVLLEKLANDPPPPHGLGRDLETIILKAMARDPGRRYATAREFAEDLDRCLAGAAILARPESAFEGMARRIRRHRSLSAASAVVAISLTIVCGLMLRARVARREQARLESEALTLLRSVAETNLDASLALRRAGLPLSAQARFLDRVEAPARDAIKRNPTLAEPHYRLGRLYRALQRFDAALAEQDRAVEKDPTYAPARYERALLDLRRWEQRLTELRASWARDEGRRLARSGQLDHAGAPPEDDVLAAGDAEASKLHDRIAGDLAALPDGTEASCLRGLVQLHGSAEAEGAKQVERSLAADSTLEEGYEGLARAAQARGNLEEAARQYTRGIAADAGYVPFRIGRAEVAAKEAERAMSFGGDPVPACERASADLTRALELDPKSSAARLRRGKILSLWADRLGESGADPEPTFARALEDLTQVVQDEPGVAGSWLAHGALQATWGYWMLDRALDPRERFALAVADFDVAIRVEHLSAAGWSGRADVRRHWAHYLKNRGEDTAEDLYRQALTDYDQALTLDPRFVTLWTSRSAVSVGLSVVARVRGEPYRELLAAGRADLDRAIDLEPRSTWILGLRAQIDMLWAGCQDQDGDDPSEVFGRAIADIDLLLKDKPAPFPRIDRATCRTQWAEHEDGLGRDAAPLITLAHDDLEAARAECGGVFGFGIAVARLELLDARRADPLVHLERARVALRESIRQNPEATEAHMRLGMVEHFEGVVRASRGEDPEPAWTAAEAAFAQALTINPRWEQVWIGRGRFRLDRAARGGDPREALADLARAVAINPICVDGWFALGSGKRRFASGDRARLEDALADLDRAVKLGPKHAASRLERARVRLALGDAEAAAEELKWVIERVPAWKKECEELLKTPGPK